MKRLDTHCGCDIPSGVTAAHLDALAFPSSIALTRALGVSLAAGKSVSYDDQVADVAIRRAIMGGD